MPRAATRFGVNPNSEMHAVIAQSATASTTAGGIQEADEVSEAWEAIRHGTPLECSA